MDQSSSPTPQQVKAAREQARLTQQACANCFGYGLRGWQQKEESGRSGRRLSVGEWQFLLLLGNQHPTWTLQAKAPTLKGR